MDDQTKRNAAARGDAAFERFDAARERIVDQDDTRDAVVTALKIIDSAHSVWKEAAVAHADRERFDERHGKLLTQLDQLKAACERREREIAL